MMLDLVTPSVAEEPWPAVSGGLRAPSPPLISSHLALGRLILASPKITCLLPSSALET